MSENVTPLFTWIHYHDGTVETNFPSPTQTPEIRKEPVEEPSPEISPQTSTEHPLYDYDKLIAESGWPYCQWWMMWKHIHPEWVLIPEKEPEIKVPPPAKPKPTFKPLTCK